MLLQAVLRHQQEIDCIRKMLDDDKQAEVFRASLARFRMKTHV